MFKVPPTTVLIQLDKTDEVYAGHPDEQRILPKQHAQIANTNGRRMTSLMCLLPLVRHLHRIPRQTRAARRISYNRRGRENAEG